MSNRLDPNLALCSFGNHLGPICLQSLSADDTKVIEVISKANIKFLTAAFLSSAEFFLNQFFKDSSFMNTIRVSRKKFGSRSGPMFYLGPNYLQNYYQTILLGFKISLDIHTAWYRIENLQKC